MFPCAWVHNRKAQMKGLHITLFEVNISKRKLQKVYLKFF